MSEEVCLQMCAKIVNFFFYFQFIEHEQLETNSQLEAELYLKQKKRNQEVGAYFPEGAEFIKN